MNTKIAILPWRNITTESKIRPTISVFHVRVIVYRPEIDPGREVLGR